MPTTPTATLDLAQALAIARAAIADVAPGHELVVLEDRTEARAFGWVFAYTTRKHRDSGDLRDAIPGTGPLVVEADGGKVTFLSTSVPPPTAIAEFERQWRARRRAP